jgi:cytochrome c oxidase assembly protein subunit 15
MPARRIITRLAQLLLTLQTLLVLTGGAVRLTGSGLGCPTWPECTGNSYTPVSGQIEGALHSWIEFGNRLLTGLLLLAIIAVVVAILASQRFDLLPLGAIQISGVIGQIVLGGITVLTDLNPFAVASHFLLSIVLIAAATSLVTRSRAHQISQPQRSSQISLHTLLTFIVIAAGTLVTGAGPHAGDVAAPRLKVRIATITAIHGALVMALILLTIFLIYRALGNSELQRSLILFLAISLAQGAIGYIQYLQGVPQLLVAAHLLGSALLWIAAWRIRLTQFYTSTPQQLSKGNFLEAEVS